MNPEIVHTQSWRYKTIVVIKRQQQTTISNKVPQVSFDVNCHSILLCPNLKWFPSKCEDSEAKSNVSRKMFFILEVDIETVPLLVDSLQSVSSTERM